MKNTYMLILVLIFSFFLLSNIYAEEKKQITLNSDHQFLSYDTPTGENITKNDLYENLLEIKEEKIIFLSNIVNWLFAIASIAITAFGYTSVRLNRKIKKDSLSVNNLIKTLEDKEKDIVKAQDSINLVLKSGDYIKKVEVFEKNLKMLEERSDKRDNEIEKITKLLKKDYSDASAESKTTDLKGSIHVVQKGNIQKQNFVLNRGDIVSIDLSEDNNMKDIRPVIVVQNDIANKHSSTVTVVPLVRRNDKETSYIFIPIKIDEEEFIAITSNLRTIGKDRIVTYLSRLDKFEILELERAIATHLDLFN